MDSEEFKIKTRVIKENFEDDRTITGPAPVHLCEVDEDIHRGGDIFITEDGELIDLELQIDDFDEEELTKYIEFAENLYEKHNKHVSVYLVCPKTINVKMKECVIKSESDFTIKLYCSQEDPCKVILDGIKSKIANSEDLTCQDLHNLAFLPVWCEKKDRHYYRVESLKIINKFLC